MSDYYVDTDVVGGSGDGSSWANAYSSLAACLAAREGNITAATSVVIHCRGVTNADTTAAAVDGWTTDATHTVTIQVDAADRGAFTAYGQGEYRLEADGGLDAGTVLIQNNYIYIYGLNIKSTRGGTYSNGIDIQTSEFNGAIGYCYIYGLGTGNYSKGIISDDNNNLKIFNTIIYDWDGGSAAYGVYMEADYGEDTSWLYNCTVCQCYTGIQSNYSETTYINCAVFNNTVDFGGTPTLINYCASDDGSGTNQQDFTAEATDWNKVFTNYSIGNFSLLNYTTSPCCVGVGTDNPGAGLYSDDIIGNARSSVWDIGAFEYVAAGGGVSMLLLNHSMGGRSVGGNCNLMSG